MPRIVKKSRKKRQIAICAIDLISENGLAKTSVEAIAKAANVGKGTVYIYFKTKEEIIIEIWEYVCELLANERKIRCKNTQSVFEKIAIFFDFSLLEQNGLLDKLLRIYATNISIVLTSASTPLRENFNQKIQEDIKSIKTIIDEGITNKQIQKVDSQLVASVFMNHFSGTLINGICKNLDIAELRSKLQTQRELLLSLLVKEGQL
ncbi:MAG: TetR/AcrR family transcriptional regulator [Sulfurospirillum sp.]|nr:TetR/AcrR family transcriptional regulator [Sulfurospirillum sp.]